MRATSKAGATAPNDWVKEAGTGGFRPQPLFRRARDNPTAGFPFRNNHLIPGDTVTFKVKLVGPIAMEEQMRFAIREGGKTVGAGVVTKIVA